MRRILSLGTTLVLTLGLNAVVNAEPRNLVPDADFAETAAITAEAVADGETPRHHGPKMPWKWYLIEGDVAASDVTYGDGSARVVGGKVFLHSDDFAVEPSQAYEVSLTAAGEGSISLGLLWWRVDEQNTRDMAEPHWTRMEKPTTIENDELTEVSAVFKAPDDANVTALRIVVNGGPVKLRDVRVTRAKQ